MDNEQQDEIVTKVQEFLSDKREYKIPDSILAWHEGDEITLEHRKAIAALDASTWKSGKQGKSETLEKLSALPDSHIAEYIATMIAANSLMSVDTFKKTFPAISANPETLTVKSFIAWDLNKDKDSH